MRCRCDEEEGEVYPILVMDVDLEGFNAMQVRWGGNEGGEEGEKRERKEERRGERRGERREIRV